MRKKITIVSLCIAFACTFAQDLTLQKEFNDNGSISFISFERRDQVTSFKDIPMIFKDDIGIDGDNSLLLKRTEMDSLGFEHQYYEQYFKGTTVEYGGYSVHLKDGNIRYITGILQPVQTKVADFKLSEAEALTAALKIIGAKTYIWEDEKELKSQKVPRGERTIIRDIIKGSKEYHPAYKFSIYALFPQSNKIYYIDAVDGHLLYAEELIKHADRAKQDNGAYTKKPIYFANVAGTGVTRYSGNQTFTTDSYSGGYRLRETRSGVTIQTLNMLNLGKNYAEAYDFTDQDNYWTATEHNNGNKDNAAVDAHWGAEKVFDYFKNVHGRNSWNNQGGAILNYVHSDLIAMDYSTNANAFWDGQRMTYGDGNGSFQPFTSLDVIAHEIGHGVMSSSANLTYRNESGALNEGFSDIWAAAVRSTYAPNKNIWQLGDEISVWGTPFRSMSDPKSGGQPNTYGGTDWYQVSGCTPSKQTDQCGVHTNSGVLNYWFYLLVTGGSGTNDLGDSYSLAGIGMADAAKIAYRAISVIITNQEATYAVARSATIQAAKDLFGAGSCQEIAVTTAWYAVGVGVVFPSNLTINGPSTFCSGQSFSTGDPATSWSLITLVGADCTLSSNSGSTVTLNFSSSGKALIRATKTICGISLSTTKEVYYGVPMVSLLTVRGTSYLSSINQPGYYGISYDNQNTCGGQNKAGISNVQWEVSPSANSIQEGSMACAMDVPAGGGKTIFFGSSGTKQIRVRVQNSCGWSNWTDFANFTVNVSGTYFNYTYYPNPANNELFISFEEDHDPVSRLNDRGAFEVHLLDDKGKIIRSEKVSGKTIRINTKALKNGNYFLHLLKDGKKEKKQLIIKH